ncbi:TPA: hypothetical protein EYO63_16845 [Candidatus Poribacteria bacterium]|jgi:hypothetical protein|nr:hypothetical protein [Candidatus Poribacteria bacterium]
MNFSVQQYRQLGYTGPVQILSPVEAPQYYLEFFKPLDKTHPVPTTDVNLIWLAPQVPLSL